VTKTVLRIRDVARKTDLSVATISRVMNNAKNVSPKTRERVLNACKEFDYLPNPAARALATKKSKTIAAIIPTIEHSVFAKFISTLEQYLADGGYSLVLSISHASEELELTAARKLLGMGAEAFILTGAAHSPELFDLFERRNVPYIVTSVWNLGSDYPQIGYNNFLLASEAIRFISEKGHTDIAVLHGPLSENDRTRMRCDGARSMQSDNLRISFFETSLDVAGGKKAIHDALESNQNFTAAMCFSDILALGTYIGLAGKGLSIPDSFSVMGFDNMDWSEAIDPPLTTIDLPARKMSEEIAKQLMRHLELGMPIQSTKVLAQIIERDSVGEISK
jgi:LacI family transcriptional regulator